jgi:hypothetical protein
MLKILVKYALLCAGLTLITGAHFVGNPQNQTLTLTIDRKVKNNQCMRGYLMTKRSDEKDAKVQCLLLETPPIGTTPTLNAIPAGTYKGKVLLDGERGWRLEILDVPGRKSFYVRLGNYPKTVTSCLLPGAKAGTDLCSVVETDAAMKDLRELFKAFESKTETMITIQ